jgi:hypothetical protein
MVQSSRELGRWEEIKEKERDLLSPLYEKVFHDSQSSDNW